MLTIITGKAKTGKTRKLMEYVRASHAMGMSRRILIVPEQLSHQTERLLSQTCGEHISFVSEVLSFTRLASRTASLYGGTAIQSLDETGRIITARLALKSIQSQLRVCAAAVSRPDFLTEIVSLIDELKTNHITSETLYEMAGKTEGVLSDKLRELGLILSAYDAAIAQGSADPRDQLVRLKKQLETYDYAKERDFFLDGFSDFTPQEYDIIEAILRKCANMTITILCDSDEDCSPVFSVGRETIAHLRAIAARTGTETTTVFTDYARPDTEQIRWLAENLFEPLPEKWAKPSENILLIPAADRIEECRKCAAFLRQQAMNGVRYRNMFVAAGNTDACMGLMEEACRELDIPLYSSHKHQLLSYSCVSFLLLAMDAVTEDLKAETMLAYLKTGYAGVSSDDVDRIENYVITWAIRGKKWSDAWKQHPDGFDGRMDDKTEEYLSHLNAMKDQALKPVLNFRTGLRKAVNVRGQAEALYHFIEDTQLYEQIQQLVQQEYESGNYTDAQELSQVWSTLMQALQQLVSVMGGLYEKPADFARIVRLSLQQYEIGTIPTVLDSVRFGAISDVRGNEPQVLCILGVNEGAVPEVASGKGFLSDRERTTLRTEYQLSIGTEVEQQLERQFLQLYSAVSAPTQRLYISWHTSEGGSSVQPSYFIERIRSIFPECLQSVEDSAGYTLDRTVQAYLLAVDSGQQSEICDTIKELTREVPEIAEKIDEARAHAAERSLSVTAEDSLRLFGSPVQLSASKLDGIWKCPLQFFMNYGINAQKREEASFNAAEFGTFVHSMLEITVPLLVQAKEHPMSEAQLGAILRSNMSVYKAERLAKNELSFRDSYLFDRNYRETMFILSDVAAELQKTDFIPSAFELKFGGTTRPALPIVAEHGTGAVVGYVDRADLWHSDQGDYFRIIDYKSGTKTFDFTEVYGGVGLQMLLYLFQLAETGLTDDGRKALPAGVLYHPAKYEFKSLDTPDPTLRKRLPRTGLVLADDAVIEAMEHGGTTDYLPVKRGKSGWGNYAVTEEQLKLLKKFVNKRMSQAVDKIIGGSFTPQPFYMGPSHSPCSYCTYKDICQKDSGFEKSCYHPQIKAAEFWQKIGDEMNGKD